MERRLVERLGDADALGRCVAAVRRTPAYTSNLYAASDQIDRWCSDGRLAAIIADKAALLLREGRGFHHLFHVAQDQGALGDALATLPEGTYVTDVIGQGDALDRVCATYAASGFADHMFLARMARVQTPGAPQAGPEQGQAAVATPADAAAVAAFLDRLLDRFAEQVPDAAELECEARAGQLLIVRQGTTRGGAIVGMLLYNLKGRSAQLRFWHVDDTARGQGVGRQLMAAFLARCAQARRLVLWVIGDNARSISIYRHYGFVADGLLDRIMIKGPVR